jgi:mannan endo-1,4-beta-mannosidase
MIDGMHWGQDHTFFISNGNGANLLANDPEHKLLFSVHAYWESSLVPDADMTSSFTGMYNSGLPFVIGEFAYDAGTTCTNTINYHLLMDLCQQYSIGYLYWWWGFYNAGSNTCLSMTPTGTYSGLAAQGLEVARTYVNSIEKTAVKPDLINYGSCSAGIYENDQPSEFSVSPNPSDGIFTLSSIHEPINIKLLDLLGNEITLTKTGPTSFSISSVRAGIYIIVVSMANGEQAIKKLIVQ